eukprot:gene3487-52406_t
MSSGGGGGAAGTLTAIWQKQAQGLPPAPAAPLPAAAAKRPKAR